MGCDIHIYRERKVNGSWETSTTETVEHYGDGDEYTSIYNGIDSFEEGATRYVGRNYVLFSFLSGVRSYGETWFMDPIAEDRGFPEDICDVNKHLLDNCDLHSHGYVTLAELLELIQETKTELTKSSIGASTLDGLSISRLLDGLNNLLETVNWDNYFEHLDPESECRILICYDN